MPTELLGRDDQPDGSPSGAKLRQEDDLLGLFASSSASNEPSTSSGVGPMSGYTEIAELFDFGATAEKKSPGEGPSNGFRTLKWEQPSYETNENKIPETTGKSFVY